MTEEQMRDLVKECGLDWHKGYQPLFDDDPTNRFAVLISAAVEAEQARCCTIIFGHCDSDNVAQRTVNAIREQT